MPVIPVDPRRHHWQSPNGPGSFIPEGRKHHHGPRYNPASWDARDTYSARLFVGFNVGGAPRWTVDDLVALVAKIRAKQERKPDATFLIQKGIFTSPKTGQTVSEDGAQVIIINAAPAVPHEAFEKEMMTLAEDIAEALEQEEVILEIQKNGISQITYGMTAR